MLQILLGRLRYRVDVQAVVAKYLNQTDLEATVCFFHKVTELLFEQDRIIDVLFAFHGVAKNNRLAFSVFRHRVGQEY
jgi:hypothetical protein